MRIIKLFKEDGAQLTYHDPYIPKFKERFVEMEGQPLTEELLKEHDLTLIITDHSCVDYDWVVKHSNAVFGYEKRHKKSKRR